MNVIDMKNVTKDFGHGRGVFDISFSVGEDEVYGFRPNGAGKSTTIRQIMGFSKPDSGSITVEGLDAWSDAAEIKKNVGSLPGEIAMPENLTGKQFINFMAELRGMHDMTYTDYLIKKFQLDPSGSIKRMSLGVKRKLAVVTAFMHDPKILILDEPTSGLDPIMQQVFTKFIKEEKKRGKTILLSSHIFSEIDDTCDKISIIKDGHLISSFNADDLKHSEEKTFKIEFIDSNNLEGFISSLPNSLKLIENRSQQNQAIIKFADKDINDFIAYTSQYQMKFCSEIKFTLEDYFMSFYAEGEKYGTN